MDGRVDGGSPEIQVPTELDKPLISTRGKVPLSRPQVPVFFVYGEFPPLGNQSLFSSSGVFFFLLLLIAGAFIQSTSTENFILILQKKSA
jgi:hypothetical protein